MLKTNIELLTKRIEAKSPLTRLVYERSVLCVVSYACAQLIESANAPVAFAFAFAFAFA